ncbi:MAG TPA: DUF2804 family protein [Rectinemataceae bacterium]|nr:DUF2804 family protein [Rectinemataceae bacterium]
MGSPLPAGNPLPEAPPEAVVDGEFRFGRYAGLFERANFLDAGKLWNVEVPRWVKTWRLKEWRAILMGDARWSMVAALYNAKLFSIALFKAWDRTSGERQGFLRIVPGSIIHMGERLSVSHSSYHGRHARLDFDFNLAEDRAKATVNWKPKPDETAFHGEFVFGCSPKTMAPSSVVLPLARNKAMYSAKALVSMEGFLETPTGIHRFDGSSSSALFDDHKGYYPFGLKYDWVGGFGIDAKGRRTGLSLAGNPSKDANRFNENSLWIGNRLFPLPPVRLSRAEGYKGDWVIQDTKGLVDLVFSPSVHNDVSFHLGLLESDWHGPFGSFKGVVKNGEGETVDASLFMGMGEEKYLRA